jgi:hypothetical protein
MTRQVWRAALHCVEHRENMNYIQTQPPNSVVIGDRCFIDDYCYMYAFVKIGWLTEKERRNIFSMENDIYKKSGTPKPIRFIFLIPPLAWNIARIEERWSREPAKWCEHNFGYLQAVRNEFENYAQFLTKKNQVKVIRETDRKQRITKVKEWVRENKLEDFIVEGEIFVESNLGTGS